MGVNVAADRERLGADEDRVSVPSVLRCGLMLLVVKAALKYRGFGWTVQTIRHRLQRVQPRPARGTNGPSAAEHAVALAGALYPGRALCLEQSLVLYYLLRRQGVAVTFCMGVQAHPFAAHAWVEYGGRPLNDVAEHVKWFTRLPEELS